MKFILAYDLGTGGTKACLYTQEGELRASEFASVKTAYPREKFHEQRPDDWWRSVVDSTRLLLETSGVNPPTCWRSPARATAWARCRCPRMAGC